MRGRAPLRVRLGEPDGGRVPALARPDDFDAYWDGEVARLEREVPLDAKMDLLPERSTEAADEYAVSFATFNGKRVHGFVTVPKKASAANPMGLRVTVPGAGPAACRTWDAAPDQIVATLNALPYRPGRDEAEQGRIYAGYNRELKEKYGVDTYPALGWDRGRVRTDHPAGPRGDQRELTSKS